MKITVLGSCSGTEPFSGCHQTSVAVETGGRVYFIDAGENAGYASYLAGVPQQDTAAIFITHTHMDHTGGLPHLLWNFRKLCTVNPDIAARMEGRVIQVHMPDPIHFEQDLRVELQQIGVCHRGLFERQDDVATVAYWYQDKPYTDFPPLPSKEERWPR